MKVQQAPQPEEWPALVRRMEEVPGPAEVLVQWPEQGKALVLGQPVPWAVEQPGLAAAITEFHRTGCRA